MTFSVKTFSYAISRAEQIINAGSKQFFISITDTTTDIETLYNNIATDIVDGFTITNNLETQTFTGYTIISIRKVFSEEGEEWISLDLAKGL